MLNHKDLAQEAGKGTPPKYWIYSQDYYSSFFLPIDEITKM